MGPVSIDDLIVVGAGQAAVELVTVIRKRGFDGSIRMIGSEPHVPYSRPPLSKEFLAGGTTADRLALTSEATLERQGVTLDLNFTVDRVDPGARLAWSGDRGWQYDALVWAAGARPTVPQWAASVRHHTVRGVDDAAELAACIRSGTSVAVLGAGFLGLEMAATMRRLGAQVTVFENATTLLPGRVSAEMAGYLHQQHTDHDVDIRLDSHVVEVRPSGRGVMIGVGTEEIRFDELVIAIGATSNSEPLARAGIACGRGVLVDERQQTSAPAIYAIGDVAAPAPGSRALPRWESVAAAKAQATRLAAVLTSAEIPAPGPASFWSHQYDAYLRIAGDVTGITRPGEAEAQREVERVPDGGGGGLVVRHHARGQLVGLESVNAPAEHRGAMRELAARPSLVTEEVLHG